MNCSFENLPDDILWILCNRFKTSKAVGVLHSNFLSGDEELADLYGHQYCCNVLSIPIRDFVLVLNLVPGSYCENPNWNVIFKECFVWSSKALTTNVILFCILVLQPHFHKSLYASNPKESVNCRFFLSETQSVLFPKNKIPKFIDFCPTLSNAFPSFISSTRLSICFDQDLLAWNFTGAINQK